MINLLRNVLRKKIIEKFYEQQVNDKQEINKSALDAMVLSKEQIDIIEDKTESLDDNMCSTISTSKNLADIFTRKKAKIMHPNNVKKLKSDNEWGHKTLFSDNL